MDLNITLKPDDPAHLYEQIYKNIRDRIIRGELKGGEKLPSTRSLSSFLHVSRSTVTLAYEQLSLEGYIAMKKNSGAYVCRTIPTNIDIDRKDSIEESTTPRKAAETEEKYIDNDRIDFSPRKIDMTAFPYATWRKILRELLVTQKADIFYRGDPQGDLSLRETIARYLRLSRGLSCAPEQVVIGAGNDYLLMLLKYILGDNRRVGMENPTYLRAYDIFKALEYEVEPVSMDEAGMQPDDLTAASCDTAYVMPAHQYPTGILMPYPRRLELLQWANEAPGRYLIEDDYDSEFKYLGKPVPALQSLDRSGKVIYIGSFSKSIAPAIRISFLILPPDLLSVYRENCSFLSGTCSRLDQSILREFIDGGYFERHLLRMRKGYRAKHDLCLSLIAQKLPDFTVHGDGAGLHVVISKDPEGRDPGQMEREMTKLALRAGVVVYPLRGQAMKEHPLSSSVPPTFLIGFAALSEEEIGRGIGILAGVWEKG